MAKQVENRVVEMEFKNKDFEKAVAVTLDSIDQLNKKLDKLNDVNVSGFEEITKAANKVDFSGILSGLETLEGRFTTITGKIKSQIQDWVIEDVIKKPLAELEKVADTVFSTIVEKGKARSQNLSQAKFQLEALGLTWEQIYADMDYAVSGTAYGLDEAAMAASQFAAANVRLGDDMKAALRGISGVAAMTGRSYSEIAQIFTTVAGKGKAMNAEIGRIEERGLGAKAAIANFINETNALGDGIRVTTDQIFDLASKGKISFEIFSQAMDTAFGAHATEANKLFTGALANTKAALGRIGERFATPLYEEIRQILVDLIPVINDFKNSLDPVVKSVEKLASGIKELATKALKDIHGSFDKESKTLLNWFGEEVDAQEKLLELVNAVAETIDGISLAFEGGLASSVGGTFINLLYNIISLIGAIKGGFEDVFGSIDGTVISRIAGKIEKLTEKLKMSDKTAKDLQNIAGGIFATVDMIFKTMDAIWNVILVPMLSALSPALGDILSTTGSLGEFLVELDKEYHPLAPMFNEIQKIKRHILPLKSSIDKMFNSIKGFINQITGIHDVESFFSKLDSIASSLHITDVFMGIAGAIAWAFDNLASFMDVLTGNESFNNYISSLAQQNTVLTWVKDTFTSIKTTIHDIVHGNKTISQALGIDDLKEKFAWLTPVLDEFKKHYKSIFEAYEGDAGSEGLPFIEQFKERLKEQLLDLDFEEIFGMVGAAFWSYLAKKKMEIDKKIANAAVSIGEGFQKIAQGLTNPLQKMVAETDADRILKIAAAIGILAGSILILGNMAPENLQRAMDTLIKLGTMIGVILAVIGLIFRRTTLTERTIDKMTETNVRTNTLSKRSMFNPVSAAIERVAERVTVGKDIITDTIPALTGVANMILAFGIAVAAIVAGLAKLTKVIKDNEEEFDTAVFALANVMASLAIIMTLMIALTGLLNSYRPGTITGTQMRGIALMFLLLGVAVGLIMNSVATLAVVTKYTGMDNLYDAITALSIIMIELFLAFTVIMAVSDMFLKVNPASIVAAAGALAIIAVAITLLMVPILALTVALANTNGGEVFVALGSVMQLLVVLTAVAMALAMMGNSFGIAGLLAGAASMLVLAIAINALIVPLAAVTALAHYDKESLHGALLTIGLLTAIFAALMVAFAIIGAGTQGIGVAGMLAGAASMYIIAKAMTAMLIPLAGIMALQMKAPGGSLGQVFTDLAIGLGILAGASIAAILLAPAIVVITSALVMLATSVWLVGDGVKRAGEGVLFFVSALALLQSIDFTTLGDKIAQAFAYMINSISSALVAGQPAILRGFTALIVTGCSAITASSAMVAEAAFKMLKDVIVAIDNHASELGFHLGHALSDVLMYALLGIAGSLSDIVDKAFGGKGKFSEQLMDSFFPDKEDNSVGKKVLGFFTKNKVADKAADAAEEAGAEAQDKMTDALTDGIDTPENQQKLTDGIESLANNSVANADFDVVKETMGISGEEGLAGIAEYFEMNGSMDKSFVMGGFGNTLVDSLAGGVTEATPEFEKAMGNLGDAGIDAFHDSKVKLGSPSKTMIQFGEWIDEGLAIGIMENHKSEEALNDKSRSLVAMFSNVGNEATSGLKSGGLSAISDSIASIADSIDSGMDFNPTITPILDLSNIHSGVSSLDSIFAANRSMQLAGEAAYLNETGRSLTMQIQNDNRNGTNNNINALGEKLDTLGEAIMNRQIVLDSGELVGGLVDPMDRSLGARAVMAQRRS